jgi:hypothetical protein
LGCGWLLKFTRDVTLYQVGVTFQHSTTAEAKKVFVFHVLVTMAFDII